MDSFHSLLELSSLTIIESHLHIIVVASYFNFPNIDYEFVIEMFQGITIQSSDLVTSYFHIL